MAVAHKASVKTEAGTSVGHDRVAQNSAGSAGRVNTDVAILGGGLAGLTLAQQISNANPDLDICVLEKNRFPVPEKTAKVGESTVEIGSRYLKTTLGMEQHFAERHLRKHGLRCFFGGPQQDFCQQDELGVSELFGIPTYQIDRGAIENHLRNSLSARGISIFDGAQISDVNISKNDKLVVASRGGETVKIKGHWLIDSAGRRNVLKSALDLSRDNDHNGNAVWFRIDRQIKIDDWTEDRSWQDRIVEPQTRWLSTNHLMGPGYWVWIIPLDNGATSFGIVMDDEAFGRADFSNYEGMMTWLRDRHPICAEEVAKGELLDYVCLRNYSHSCKQLFSDQGWGITGEAGVFADPFYSPGSDFIAFGNTFITDLVSRWRSGEDVRIQTRVYDRVYQSFFASTLSLYQGNYGGFGDRRMMSLKLVWDYAYYWGVLAVLFFREVLTDSQLMRELSPPLQKVQALNAAVQDRFRLRAKMRAVQPARGLFINQYQVPCLRDLSARLERPSGGCASSVKEELLENCALLERLALHIGNLLFDDSIQPICAEELALLGEYRHSVLAA